MKDVFTEKICIFSFLNIFSLIIALSLHKKSLPHHNTHSTIAQLRGASINFTDRVVLFSHYTRKYELGRESAPPT